MNSRIASAGLTLATLAALGLATARPAFAITPPTTAPEPSTVVPFALLGLALLGLGVRARRRNKGQE